MSDAADRICPTTLGRKNALFAGSDRGDAHWTVIASLIGTSWLHDANPHAYLVDALQRIVAGHPQSRIDAHAVEFHGSSRHATGPSLTDMRRCPPKVITGLVREIILE